MTVTTAASTSNFADVVAELIAAKAEENLRSVKPWVSPSNKFQTQFYKTGTDTIVFPYFADIAYSASSAALTEGTMPTPAQLAVDSESMTFVQHGYVVGNADIAMLEYPQLMEVAADRIAENAALVIDTYARSVLVAGTAVIYGGTASYRSTLTTGITSAKVQEAAARLRKLNVKPFPDGTYKCIATAEQIIALQAETTKGAWIDKALYSGAREIMTGEAGMMWGVRFVDAGSQQYIVSSAGSASADVHVALIFGPGYAGWCDMQGVTVKYVPAGGDHSDVLAQQALVGWKWAGGVKILLKAGERGTRLETVQTTLS